MASSLGVEVHEARRAGAALGQREPLRAQVVLGHHQRRARSCRRACSARRCAGIARDRAAGSRRPTPGSPSSRHHGISSASAPGSTPDQAPPVRRPGSRSRTRPSAPGTARSQLAVGQLRLAGSPRSAGAVGRARRACSANELVDRGTRAATRCRVAFHSRPAPDAAARPCRAASKRGDRPHDGQRRRICSSRRQVAPRSDARTRRVRSNRSVLYSSQAVARPRSPALPPREGQCQAEVDPSAAVLHGFEGARFRQTPKSSWKTLRGSMASWSERSPGVDQGSGDRRWRSTSSSSTSFSNGRSWWAKAVEGVPSRDLGESDPRS